MNHYIYLWTRSEYEYHRKDCNSDMPEGQCKMVHAAGNQFLKRGIKKGDYVYVVACFKNTLFLMGRMYVDGLYSPRNAARKLGRKISEIDWASDHIIVNENDAEPMFFEKRVSVNEINKLRFIVKKTGRLKAPKFRNKENKKYVEPQTFRGVRQITEESALILNEIINRN